MNSIFAAGFLMMLTLLVKSLLLDSDLRGHKPQRVESI